jgi:hypothetical protein
VVRSASGPHARTENGGRCPVGSSSGIHCAGCRRRRRERRGSGEQLMVQTVWKSKVKVQGFGKVGVKDEVERMRSKEASTE